MFLTDNAIRRLSIVMIMLEVLWFEIPPVNAARPTGRAARSTAKARPQTKSTTTKQKLSNSLSRKRTTSRGNSSRAPNSRLTSASRTSAKKTKTFKQTIKRKAASLKSRVTSVSKRVSNGIKPTKKLTMHSPTGKSVMAKTANNKPPSRFERLIASARSAKATLSAKFSQPSHGPGKSRGARNPYDSVRPSDFKNAATSQYQSLHLLPPGSPGGVLPRTSQYQSLQLLPPGSPGGVLPASSQYQSLQLIPRKSTGAGNYESPRAAISNPGAYGPPPRKPAAGASKANNGYGPPPKQPPYGIPPPRPTGRQYHDVPRRSGTSPQNPTANKRLAPVIRSGYGPPPKKPIYGVPIRRPQPSGGPYHNAPRKN